MALMLNKTFGILNDEPPISDPRMDRFLMRAPLQPITISLLYLLFIYKIGPKLMEKLKPFHLKNIIVAYNISQIVINTVLFYMFLQVAPFASVLCAPPAPLINSPSINLALEAHYYYTLLKYYDMVETIFFVLRKKKRQISYLHVHHHVGILAAAWISCKYFPGGQALFVGLYNTFIHALMYCYYLLTSLDSNYTKNLWWKKYVTLLQIIQHFMIFFSVAPSVVNINCSYSKFWMGAFSMNVLLIIYLFGKFYINNYLKKKD